jgi:hypothetical protein
VPPPRGRTPRGRGRQGPVRPSRSCVFPKEEIEDTKSERQETKRGRGGGFLPRSEDRSQKDGNLSPKEQNEDKKQEGSETKTESKRKLTIILLFLSDFVFETMRTACKKKNQKFNKYCYYKNGPYDKKKTVNHRTKVNLLGLWTRSITCRWAARSTPASWLPFISTWRRSWCVPATTAPFVDVGPHINII